MSYSLLNRFRGAWLGSFVPAIISSKDKISGTEGNLDSQGLTVKVQQQYAIWLNLARNNFVSAEIPAQAASTEDDSVVGVIIDFLPVIFFLHDDWCALKTLMTNQVRFYGLSPTEEVEILAWCYLLRLALRGHADFSEIPKLLKLGMGRSTAELEWLKILTSSISLGKGQEQLEQQFLQKQNSPIPLSLYFFLSNAHDFKLALLQALGQEILASDIALLTGILSGAYNGYTGMPSGWRVRLQKHQFFADICQHAEVMARHWCGSEITSQSISPSIITAPRIYQRRDSLKIISQEEYA